MGEHPSGFTLPDLDDERVAWLEETARLARADILTMTTVAGSGHPGGALSSVDVFLLLWSLAHVSPQGAGDPDRDRIVVSHGHTSAAAYSVLGRLGYIDRESAIRSLRRAGSPFEGHATRLVPGIEWACGCLGQGLSAACGMALAARLTGRAYRVFCVMGDGEQQKGQIAEARRLAAKHGLANLTAIVDCNDLQATGAVEDVMPHDLREDWRASGWQVLEADGHDFRSLYAALLAASSADTPTVILARTVMGKGVPSIEGRYEYHGKVLTRAECESALASMGVSPMIPEPAPPMDMNLCPAIDPVESRVVAGNPRTYTEPTDCRSAFGRALADVAEANPDVPMAVFDCDLAGSVKVDAFVRVRPEGLVECGIQEHSAATMAGAASVSGALTFLAGFGVFVLGESYNQHRMNDVNDASLKLICTHCGLDVGEDGKSHQCVDYIGLVASMFGYRLIVPADANQADRVTRYIASTPGRFILAMGRSAQPVIAMEDGRPLFGDDYGFEYVKADWVRDGRDGTIVATGAMVWRAIAVRELLLAEDLHFGVLNLSCPLDLDTERLDEAARTGFVATYEDHNARTGIGSLVAQRLAEAGGACRLMRFGVTRYGVSGCPEANYERQGLDPASVASAVSSKYRGKGSGGSDEG